MSETAQEAGGGGSKMLLVVGLLVGVAIGGGAAYSFLGQQAPAPTEEDSKEEVVEKEPEIDLRPMEMKKLSVPVFYMRGGKSYGAGNFVLDFSLMCKPEHYTYVTNHRLALRQATLSALNKYDVMKDGSYTEIDYDKASRAILYAARQVVGKEKIDKVLITNSQRVP